MGKWVNETVLTDISIDRLVKNAIKKETAGSLGLVTELHLIYKYLCQKYKRLFKRPDNCLDGDLIVKLGLTPGSQKHMPAVIIKT